MKTHHIMLNYVKYYHLEQFLFNDVHQHFQVDHSVGAFDFFSIVIWKANRAKSKVAQRLWKHATPDERSLDVIVRRLTRSIYEASDHSDRMKVLLKDWRFRLPMASAILAVFWPDEFTVYDVRVCDELQQRSLGDFRRLGGRNNPEHVCKEYFKYRNAVECAVSHFPSLRDKDRYLWGHSSAKQLDEDLSTGFKTTKGEES